MSPPILKVAAIQAEPVWFDLQGGVEKVISLIKEAAENGAQLIAFPESFIPGYPACIWSGGFDQDFLVNFQKNCLDVQSEEFNKIRRATRDAKIW
jgi:nitrilase